jgi:Protein of unknown function (DUF4239)
LFALVHHGGHGQRLTPKQVQCRQSGFDLTLQGELPQRLQSKEIEGMLDPLYESNIAITCVVTILLIVGATELGGWIGQRRRRLLTGKAPDVSTLTGASLGLLALLLAFSFSLALSRYDARRSMVVEEANTIGSAANFALMLPEPAQRRILPLLHDYAVVRTELGVPYNPTKFDTDVARSLDLQNQLWQEAVSLTASSPQSRPVYRFVASLNELNNIHETRVSALRYHVPAPVMAVLIGVAIVAMGFAGYQARVMGLTQRIAMLIMSLMLAAVIMLIVDLDLPSRGLIQIPVRALIDATQGIPR